MFSQSTRVPLAALFTLLLIGLIFSAAHWTTSAAASLLVWQTAAQMQTANDNENPQSEHSLINDVLAPTLGNFREERY